MRAKKSLGQHFLRRPEYAQRLVAGVSADARNIVEVGPGTGMLTRYLVRPGVRLLLIEKDSVLAERARELWKDNASVEVVEDDFLSFDLRGYFGRDPFVVVGNFPYNISSQIVFRILGLHDQVTEMVGMFQLEVAQRIVAPPGSKQYGIISVLTAVRYHGELLFSVPPGAFDPPPKVRSAVIRLRQKTNRDLPCAYETLQRIVRVAFGQRRKMLRNSLRPLLPGEVLQDPVFQKRPEQLGLDEFVQLALTYERLMEK